MDSQSDQGGTAVQSQDQGNHQSGAQAATQAQVVKFAGREYHLDKPEEVKALEDDTNRLNKEFHARNQQRSQQGQPDETEQQLEQLTDLLAPRLAERGYVTQDEVKLQNLLTLNPALRAREQELRELANLPSNRGKAFEDIAATYNLVPSDKLVRAKASEVKGEPIPKEAPQGKSVRDMSPEEYDQWKKENLGKTNLWTKK